MDARRIFFAALAAPAIAHAAACDAPEHRQFDFWVGQWDVTDKGKVIKSVNFYDGALKRWRQQWVDSVGNSSEWVGGLRDGAMRFDGEAHRADGVKVTRNMTFTPLADGSVRQASDRSLDGGKTWLPGYDFVYVRRP